MKTWGVTVPIAGHAWIEVKAENEEEAINTALDNVNSSHLQDWESLRQFVRVEEVGGREWTRLTIIL